MGGGIAPLRPDAMEAKSHACLVLAPNKPLREPTDAPFAIDASNGRLTLCQQLLTAKHFIAVLDPRSLGMHGRRPQLQRVVKECRQKVAHRGFRYDEEDASLFKLEVA